MNKYKSMESTTRKFFLRSVKLEQMVLMDKVVNTFCNEAQHFGEFIADVYFC